MNTKSINYQEKYIKYKKKYLNLKINSKGGAVSSSGRDSSGNFVAPRLQTPPIRQPQLRAIQKQSQDLGWKKSAPFIEKLRLEAESSRPKPDITSPKSQLQTDITLPESQPQLMMIANFKYRRNIENPIERYFDGQGYKMNAVLFLFSNAQIIEFVRYVRYEGGRHDRKHIKYYFDYHQLDNKSRLIKQFKRYLEDKYYNLSQKRRSTSDDRGAAAKDSQSNTLDDVHFGYPLNKDDSDGDQDLRPRNDQVSTEMKYYYSRGNIYLSKVNTTKGQESISLVRKDEKLDPKVRGHSYSSTKSGSDEEEYANSVYGEDEYANSVYSEEEYASSVYDEEEYASSVYDEEEYTKMGSAAVGQTYIRYFDLQGDKYLELTIGNKTIKNFIVMLEEPYYRYGHDSPEPDNPDYARVADGYEHHGPEDINSRDLETFFGDHLLDEKEGKKIIGKKTLSSVFELMKGKSKENIFTKLQTDEPESSSAYNRIREFFVGSDKKYPPEIQALIDRRDELLEIIENCCLKEKIELRMINDKLNEIFEKMR